MLTDAQASLQTYLPKLVPKLALALLAAAGAVSPAAANGDFDGLAWGAGKLDLLSRFPAATRERFIGCNDPASLYAKWKVDCQGYVLRGYRIGDLRFNAAFWLSAETQGLMRVSLIHNPTQQDKARALAGCHLTFRQLVERHGEPASHDMWMTAVADHTQAEWLLPGGQTQVSMSCVAGTARSTIHVTYQPTTDAPR
ncbi:hypothetical protein [Uliginosibacterium sp. H1]|uniref:hypothetical protein n=1 Tax=Uliginosibacterium sp. H1 TaxID=3114757 RepID=UPI002E186CEB|nr:hypothetical protein [Uliginosibacterium sp. H1]